MLGWAVYFGHSPQAEEVIKWALSLVSTNPFLPMREGFFRAKTAKEIAEYYQRKNLVQLLEQCEKSRDETMRTAGDALRLQLLAERPADVQGKQKEPVRTKRRESKFVPIEQAPPMDKKAKPNEALKEGLRGTPSPPVAPLPESSKAPSPTVVTESPVTAPAAEVSTSVRAETSPTTVAIGDRVLLASSLSSKAQSSETVDSLKRSSNQRLMVKPVLATRTTPAVNPPTATPEADCNPPRAPSPLSEDPAERVEVQAEVTETTPARSVTNEFNGIDTTGIRLPPGKRYHVLLSYTWGKFQTTRSRVKLLAKILESHGLKVWLTEDHVEDDVLSAIHQGINESVLVAVCLTKGYSDRIAAYARAKAPQLDWCVAEFNAAFSAVSRTPMMTVIMDPAMLDWNKWIGDIALALKGAELVDFTSDKDWDGSAARIAEVVHRLTS